MARSIARNVDRTGYMACCMAYYLTVALLARDRPDFYLFDFHVSKTLNSTTTKMHFDLMIVNNNSFTGLYYNDPVSLTFTYFPPTTIAKNTSIIIGKHTIQGFYQGGGMIKLVQNSVVVQDVFSWAATTKEPARVAILRVDLDGRLKFRSIENKKLHLVARAAVEVNCNTRNIVQNNTVHLKYASGSNSWGVLQWLMFPLLWLLTTMVCVVVLIPCIAIIQIFVLFFCCAPVRIIRWLYT